MCERVCECVCVSVCERERVCVCMCEGVREAEVYKEEGRKINIIIKGRGW